VHVPSRHHLSAEEEKQRYDRHTNTMEDDGYVEYLTAFAQVLERIPVQDPDVLDFGSGPNAALTTILLGRGIRCRAYDPLYGVGEDALQRPCDVLMACEVLEHLRDLPTELARMGAVIRPDGYLVCRTRFRPADAEFGQWWYANDPTHINFFSTVALQYVSDVLRAPLAFVEQPDTVAYGPFPAG
jgi:hypothetical protein